MRNRLSRMRASAMVLFVAIGVGGVVVGALVLGRLAFVGESETPPGSVTADQSETGDKSPRYFTVESDDYLSSDDTTRTHVVGGADIPADHKCTGKSELRRKLSTVDRYGRSFYEPIGSEKVWQHILIALGDSAVWSGAGLELTPFDLPSVLGAIDVAIAADSSDPLRWCFKGLIHFRVGEAEWELGMAAMDMAYEAYRGTPVASRSRVFRCKYHYMVALSLAIVGREENACDVLARGIEFSRNFPLALDLERSVLGCGPR